MKMPDAMARDAILEMLERGNGSTEISVANIATLGHCNAEIARFALKNMQAAKEIKVDGSYQGDNDYITIHRLT